MGWSGCVVINECRAIAVFGRPMTAPCRKYVRREAGTQCPTLPAASTIKGKGASSTKIAKKAAAAMVQSLGFFKARLPMRCAA